MCIPTELSYSCQCEEGFNGDPYIKCNANECFGNGDCLPNQHCSNNKCINPCEELNCVENAQCVVRNHVAQCLCKEGFSGNPSRFCEAIEIPACNKDSDCQGLLACIHGKCTDACKTIHPCGKNAICSSIAKEDVVVMACSCPENYGGDARTSCRPGKDTLKLNISYRMHYFALQKVFIFLYLFISHCLVFSFFLVVQPKGECDGDDDCPFELACEQKKCVSPCPGGCGVNASCSVQDHRPLCHCWQNYAGDPQIGCYEIGCTHDDDCPESESCINFVCANPCKRNNFCADTAECYTRQHQATCRCPSGTEGDPMEFCSPVGCTSNNQCASFEACLNRACIDPCAGSDVCGVGAKCEVRDHEIACKCPRGTSGNPREFCEKVSNLTGCATDKDCPEGFGCIYEGSPIRYHSEVSAVYIRFDDASSGTICRDLCYEREPCGENAICTVLETEPRRTMSCSCPPGYHGDAKIECRKSECFFYLQL